MRKLNLKILLFLLFAVGLSGMALPSAASAETIDPKDGVVTFMIPNKKYKCDLNNDQKTDIIYYAYSYFHEGEDREAFQDLYINQKKVLSVSEEVVTAFYLFDLNKKDNYIEIYARSPKLSKSILYHYNGKRLVKYASGLYGDGTILKKRIPDSVYYYQKQKGDGFYTVSANVSGFPSHKYLEVMLQFKVVNKKLTFQSNVEHDFYMEKPYYEKASGNLTAYKNPVRSGGEKAFTLKKGDSYIFKKIKFSKPYSFIQIQNKKTKAVGWINVKTSKLTLSITTKGRDY